MSNVSDEATGTPEERAEVGKDFVEAQRSTLRDIAWEALRMHRALDSGTFGTVDDVQCFRYDCERLEEAARTLDLNSKRVQRYFKDLGLLKQADLPEEQPDAPDERFLGRAD